MSVNPNSGSVRKRRQKRTLILIRLEELRYESPTYRTKTMNEEFGPYWYYLLRLDCSIPVALKFNKRYVRWVQCIDVNQ